MIYNEDVVSAASRSRIHQTRGQALDRLDPFPPFRCLGPFRRSVPQSASRCLSTAPHYLLEVDLQGWYTTGSVVICLPPIIRNKSLFDSGNFPIRWHLMDLGKRNEFYNRTSTTFLHCPESRNLFSFM